MDSIPGDGFTWMILLVGALSLWLGYRVNFTSADASQTGRWASRPLRFLELGWLAGGRTRYFRQIGWLILALGAWLIVRAAVSK